MSIGLIVVIIFLIMLVIFLIIYNLSIYKKVKGLSNTHEKIANLRVLQDFMDTIGKDASAEDKIKIINDIIIEKYNIKYSTIVVFNGAEYILINTENMEISKYIFELFKELYNIDIKLYNKINEILEEHIKTRHIKGGESTRLKYLKNA